MSGMPFWNTSGKKVPGPKSSAIVALSGDQQRAECRTHRAVDAGGVEVTAVDRCLDHAVEPVEEELRGELGIGELELAVGDTGAHHVEQARVHARQFVLL